MGSGVLGGWVGVRSCVVVVTAIQLEEYGYRLWYGYQSKKCGEGRQKGKVTGGMFADLLYHRRIISKSGSQNHMPGGLMGRYPPIAANERYLMLVPALKERGWLFLRLGAKRMVQPALRGILMTYINA